VALLAYLAAEGGSRHRGELIELLWSGSDEAHGRAALRSALSSLRKALEESAEPSEKPHLLTDGDSVGLATGAAVEDSRDNRAVCEPGVGRRLGSGASLCPKGDGDQGCGADEVDVHGLHPPLRDGGAAKSGQERLAREEVRRLGERVGQNKRFRLVYLRMLAVLDGWDGATEGALGHLREAATPAEEIGLPGELWQIEALMAELHQERGDEERARDAFSRAAQTLRSLAGRIDDPTLQASFLGAPRVRRVLER
jgi:hypothetical protein